jgi:hypothetical protein
MPESSDSDPVGVPCPGCRPLPGGDIYARQALAAAIEEYASETGDPVFACLPLAETVPILLRKAIPDEDAGL